MKSQYFAIALMCALFVSCAKWGNSENYRLMLQAQALVEQMPDSALILLDMVNTAPLNRAQTAEYTLLRVQARNNADNDMCSDTEIFMAYDYLKNKKDYENAALAGFYSACVAKARNDAALEMDYYLQALELAQKTDNRILQGKLYYNMGYLNYRRRWFTEAVQQYRLALNFFQTDSAQFHREIYTLNAISNAFLVNQLNDSAHYYYQAALERAHVHADTAMLIMVYSNMGAFYQEQGMLDTALHYSRKALFLANDDNEKALIYMNFADVFLDKNSIDSSRFYLNLVELLFKPLENHYTRASIDYLHYQIEKAEGNFLKALEYYELYNQYHEELTDSHDRQTVLELQKKYDKAASENEHNREKTRWLIITWVFGYSALFFSIAVLAVILKIKNNRMI